MATHILIVDDRPQDRFLAKRALATEFPDLELTEVRDQAEFVAALDRQAYDVIITDYQLQWTDGLQVLATIRSRGLDTPVVMFTQTGSEEVAAAGLRAGLADYIIKTPTHYSRLAHAVRIALHNVAAARNERAAHDREREALRTAEEALRLKDEFLATLSHELRTPLSAISGWLQIMKMRPDQDRMARGLSAIERNTNLLVRLIDDLVDVSRIVSGTLTLDVHSIDLRKVVDAAVESVRPDTQAKRLHIEVTGPPMAFYIAADPDRLQQVVWNLLSNAIKFTPADGRITVSIERVGSMIDLSVADTGPGIRKEFLPHVFDRFSQEDAGKNRQHGGMGLGLAIVRHLTEMHGGTVSVTSVEGAGARFSVRLPVAPAIAPRPNKATWEEPRAELSGVRVLIIDDQEDAREVACRMLEDHGAMVATATSAAEGFDALIQQGRDVLICDIGMPDEDGLTLIARLRKAPDAAVASIPALVVTAYVREYDRQRALGAGFDAYLPKPFSGSELIKTVRQLADLRLIGRDRQRHT